MTTEDKLDYVLRMADAVVQEAERLGVVLTIESVPITPLAMGNHCMQVSVRPERPLAEPILREA